MNTANLPLIEGFYLSAGLIVGFGPQSTLILRQGLRRQHLRLIVVICTLVDAVLIMPDPSSRLIARTVMSWSQSTWHDSLIPVRPLAASRSCSATVIFDGSPSMNSTRQVVHRALPPHAWRISTPASCSIALTNRFPVGTSNVP